MRSEQYIGFFGLILIVTSFFWFLLGFRMGVDAMKQKIDESRNKPKKSFKERVKEVQENKPPNELT